MGIGYKDAVVLYNRHYNDTLETEYYFGTLFENVRIELTQAENISKSGMKDADSFLVKIPNDGTLNYVNPPDWENMSEEEKLKHFTLRSNDFDFVVIAKKDEFLIDRELPVGLINSDDYPGKFFQYMLNEKGNCYKVNTISVYSLIPRFEIGGK
jgi:hypothetical protein